MHIYQQHTSSTSICRRLQFTWKLRCFTIKAPSGKSFNFWLEGKVTFFGWPMWLAHSSWPHAVCQGSYHTALSTRWFYLRQGDRELDTALNQTCNKLFSEKAFTIGAPHVLSYFFSSNREAMFLFCNGLWPLLILSFAYRSTRSAVWQIQATACMQSASTLRFVTIKRSVWSEKLEFLCRRA